MTEEIIEEKIKDLIPENITGEMSEDILALKKEIAKKYIEELKDKKDMWMWKLLIGKGKSLENYLVSENKWDQILDTIKWNIMDKLFGSVDKQSFVIGWITYNSIFEYLKPIKEKLDNAKTEAELKILENEILTASTIVAPVVASTMVDTNTSQESSIEYDDQSAREKIITSMNNLIEKDKVTSIPYVRWGEDIDKEWWLDCSGMVDYVLKEAWADLLLWKELVERNTTRQYFKETWAKLVLWKNEATTKEEWLELIKKEWRLQWLQKWDIVIWNSVAEEYQPDWSEMEYKGKEYYLHHIAMIKSVDEDKWTIDILESNGSQWVTESTIDIWERLYWEKYKKKASEMYVGKMDYTAYFPNTTMPNQMVA